jgi:hypothetical protein
MAEEKGKAILRFRPGAGGEPGGVVIDFSPVVAAIVHLETKLDELNENVKAILQTQKNSPRITVGNLSVPTPGKPVNLPVISVPDGKTGVLYAPQTNGGNIYFGGSQSEAAAKKFPIPPGDSRSLRITNFNQIWIDADVANEGISYGVEVNLV